MLATEKICHVCGQDVSRQKRTKDLQGRYYCQPCYDSLSAKQPPSQADPAAYVCATCGRSFAVDDVYDEHGTIICTGCWSLRGANTSTTKAKTVAPSRSASCPSCGVALATDAAFCSRCGTSTPENGVSLPDQIDLTEAVHWVSMYAEAAGTIATLHRLSDNVETLAARGHRIDPAEAKGMLEVAMREAQNADRVVTQAKTNLRQFDRLRLIAIRDNMLGHNSVSG